jgi:hypothetical protein
MGQRVCVLCGRAAKPGRFSCNDCGGTIVERAATVSTPAPASPSSTQWAPTERWTPEDAAPVPVAAPVAPEPPPLWAPAAQPDPPPPLWAPPAPTGWAPPVGDVAPPRRKGSALKIVLSIGASLAVLFVGLVVAIAILGNNAPPALDGYMDGKGTTYSFPGDTASVRMPEEPELKTQNENGIVAMLAGVEHKTYEMWFYKYEGASLRRANPATIRTRLKAMTEASADAAGISIERSNDHPVAGYPAHALHGTVKGDQADAVFIYVRGKVYGLFVHTNKGSAQVLKEFEQSFRLR